MDLLQVVGLLPRRPLQDLARGPIRCHPRLDRPGRPGLVGRASVEAAVGRPDGADDAVAAGAGTGLIRPQRVHDVVQELVDLVLLVALAELGGLELLVAHVGGRLHPVGRRAADRRARFPRAQGRDELIQVFVDLVLLVALAELGGLELHILNPVRGRHPHGLPGLDGLAGGTLAVGIPDDAVAAGSYGAVAAGAGLVVLQCPDGLIHEQVDRALLVALAKAGGAEPLARHVVGRQDPVGRAGDGAGLPRAQGRGDALDEDVDLLQVVARLESGRHEGGVRGLVGCQRHNGLLDSCRGGGRRVRRGE